MPCKPQAHIKPRAIAANSHALGLPAYEPVVKFPVKREHGGIWSRDDRDD